jgi:hypothetical protein
MIRFAAYELTSRTSTRKPWQLPLRDDWRLLVDHAGSTATTEKKWARSQPAVKSATVPQASHYLTSKAASVPDNPSFVAYRSTMSARWTDFAQCKPS